MMRRRWNRRRRTSTLRWLPGKRAHHGDVLALVDGHIVWRISGTLMTIGAPTGVPPEGSGNVGPATPVAEREK